MGVRQECFRAVRRPFDRAIDFLSGPDCRGFLGIDKYLAAETTADIRGNDPQLVLRRYPEEGRHDQPRHMGVLAGRMERQFAAAGIIFAKGCARFHRVGRQAVVHKVDLRDMCRV